MKQALNTPHQLLESEHGHSPLVRKCRQKTTNLSASTKMLKENFYIGLINLITAIICEVV